MAARWTHSSHTTDSCGKPVNQMHFSVLISRSIPFSNEHNVKTIERYEVMSPDEQTEVETKQCHEDGHVCAEIPSSDGLIVPIFIFKLFIKYDLMLYCNFILFI